MEQEKKKEGKKRLSEALWEDFPKTFKIKNDKENKHVRTSNQEISK